MGNPMIRLTILVLVWFLAGRSTAQISESAKPLLLVMGPAGTEMPAREAFQDVYRTIEEELISDVRIVFRTVNKNTTYDEFATSLEASWPRILVLLDNSAISHYLDYQRRHREDTVFPPAIFAMALFVEDMVEQAINAVGIGYQVSPVTSVVNLRNLIGRPLDRVGIIYRKQYESYIRKQQEYCKPEKLELVGYAIENGLTGKELASAIRRGIHWLTLKAKVDGMVILNDNALLAPESGRTSGVGGISTVIETVWEPGLRRFRKPVIVGVGPLIMNSTLGNFAVLPDHQGIGKHISELVYQILDENLSGLFGSVNQTESVQTILKLGFAKKYLRVKKDKLGEVDILLEK